MIFFILAALFLFLRFIPGNSLSTKHLLYVAGSVLGAFLFCFGSIMAYDKIERYLHPEYNQTNIDQIRQELQDIPQQPKPEKGVQFI